jgi:hypothetical protein
MHAPVDDLLLLESIWMVTFPGNPSSNAYEISFPENNATDVILHGIVILSTVEQPNGGKAFSLTVSDYIWDNIRTSTILYVFPRFHHTPLSMTIMICSQDVLFQTHLDGHML